VLSNDLVERPATMPTRKDTVRHGGPRGSSLEKVDTRWLVALLLELHWGLIA
jgi:hypothetical protein